MKPLLLFALLPLSLAAQTNTLDLNNLYNYANQSVPAYITKDNTPANNPITDLGSTLGRVLFYDTRLSRNNTVSCASCHQQEHAFGDPLTASIGVSGMTGRHSMRLINARFAREQRFFWDERAASLEIQTTQPIQDHVEMGFSGTEGDPALSDLVQRLSQIELYQVLFTGVFGDSSITENRIQRSLAQFVRSIQSFDSKYDEGRALAPNDNANFTNFTAQENQGKQLFLAPPNQGGAGCAGCHQPPEFDITPNSGHNGVIGSLGGGQDPTNTRSPSIRDLVNANGNPHGGFMHNAAFNNILEVINHYNAIPAVTQGLDPRLAGRGMGQRLNLTNNEKNALIAFLETLTGESVYTDEKWSNPFNEDGTLPFITLPTDQIQIDSYLEANELHAEITSPGVPNVQYLLKTSSDLVTWDEGTPVTANADGLISFSTAIEQDQAYFKLVYETSE